MARLSGRATVRGTQRAPRAYTDLAVIDQAGRTADVDGVPLEAFHRGLGARPEITVAPRRSHAGSPVLHQALHFPHPDARVAALRQRRARVIATKASSCGLDTCWVFNRRPVASNNYRTITNDQGGWVKLQLDVRPKLANGTNDQIKWRLIGNDGSIWDGATYYIADTSWHWLTQKPVGWQFRNSFARYTTCTSSGCNHNFSGNMDY